MENNMNQPLLSICIPTWNRAQFLKLSLDSIKEQLSDIDNSRLEILVSDNCSTDSTPELVRNYMDAGMPIKYNRNNENKGYDGNFLKCIQLAVGKYILLLGDDDILLPGTIQYLLSVLEKDDWGLVHISSEKGGNEVEIFSNPNECLEKIGYWITFISANIFRSDIVTLIEDPERYYNTYFLQIPFYIKSALSRGKSLKVTRAILDAGLDRESNGGYNIYEVFVKSYLSIWHEFLDNKEIPISVYKSVKKNMLMKFLIPWNYKFLCRRKGIKKAVGKNCGRNGFAIDNAWIILFHYYGKCWYFYYSLILLPYLGLKDAVKYGLKCIGLRK